LARKKPVKSMQSDSRAKNRWRSGVLFLDVDTFETTRRTHSSVCHPQIAFVVYSLDPAEPLRAKIPPFEGGGGLLSALRQ
jgi:hypothetical protein